MSKVKSTHSLKSREGEKGQSIKKIQVSIGNSLPEEVQRKEQVRTGQGCKQARSTYFLKSVERTKSQNMESIGVNECTYNLESIEGKTSENTERI